MKENSLWSLPCNLRFKSPLKYQIILKFFFLGVTEVTPYCDIHQIHPPGNVFFIRSGGGGGGYYTFESMLVNLKLV